MLLYIFVFLTSAFLLYVSGKLLVDGLARLAFLLRWKEFVLSFVVMAFAASLSNLFVGISAAARKISVLSLGDVLGGNVFDLTVAIALAVFFVRGGAINTESRTVQQSTVFTVVTAILPLILVFDGNIDRPDGILLIILFLVYMFWLFAREDRFSHIYEPGVWSRRSFEAMFKSLGQLLLGGVMVVAAAEGIVRSAVFFSDNLGLSLGMMGILLIAVGNALPETYFGIFAARRGKGDMVLGDLLSSVIVPSTLVLGVVALIYPIQISGFSSFAVARIFLMIAALLFIVFVRSDKSITRKEGVVFLVLYVFFVLTEIIFRT